MITDFNRVDDNSNEFQYNDLSIEMIYLPRLDRTIFFINDQDSIDGHIECKYVWGEYNSIEEIEEILKNVINS